MLEVTLICPLRIIGRKQGELLRIGSPIPSELCFIIGQYATKNPVMHKHRLVKLNTRIC
jgi:hypothetical protein